MLGKEGTCTIQMNFDPHLRCFVISKTCAKQLNPTTEPHPFRNHEASVRIHDNKLTMMMLK